MIEPLPVVDNVPALLTFASDERLYQGTLAGQSDDIKRRIQTVEQDYYAMLGKALERAVRTGIQDEIWQLTGHRLDRTGEVRGTLLFIGGLLIGSVIGLSLGSLIQ